MQATVAVVESLPGGPIASTPPLTPTPEAMATEEPTPSPTHEAMVMEVPTLTPTNGAMTMGELTPTPTPETGTEEITSTPEPTRQDPAFQEFAIIENYAATRFFPGEIVVLKGIPVKLYLTRLHREHVNKFAISPFFSSSAVILPGEVGLMEFLPDELGEFKIRNVGHNFEATLVVLETMADVRQHFVDKGVKMFALIHSVDDSRVFPEISFVVKDVPVKVLNISLTTDHKVSISPFYVPDDINVRLREITSFDFTPDSTGEFTILNEIHGFTGTLIVEDGG